MDFKEIQNYIKGRNYIISEHADEEKTYDKLTVEDIEAAVLSGEVIEERTDDVRGKSSLVAGRSKDGRLLHVVIGLRSGRPVIVPVYAPSEELWISGKIRKR